MAPRPDNVMAVIDALDCGLPFARLRAKWAGAVGSGARKMPARTRPAATLPARRGAGADAPVSGGAGAVLRRGAGTVWTDDMDLALLGAGEAEIDDVAAKIGVGGAEARRRRAAIWADVARAMSEGA